MIICAPIEGGIPFWWHSKPSKWLHIKKMETFGGLWVNEQLQQQRQQERQQIQLQSDGS